MPAGHRQPEDNGPLHAEGCLFCRRIDGGFTSREHVFSEALGNHEYVLQPGVVCDRCNNGPLARVDNALIGFAPIELLRSERGLPTKDGKGVVMRLGGTSVWFSAPGELNVETNSKKVARGLMRTPAERKAWELPLKGAEGREAKFRAIILSAWKSALELIYWDEGAAQAFLPKYDTTRDAVLQPKTARGFGIVPQQIVTAEDVSLEYNFMEVNGRPAVPVRMSVFGVLFLTDLLRPAISPAEVKLFPWPVNVWTFGSGE